MDAKRGIRMTQDRLLSDLTPNPGYVVEWTVAFHADMKTGGALHISKEVAKYILDLKKNFCRFYAKHYNILADQKEYTLALYRYMLYLGAMVKGDYLCVNQFKHDKVKVFDTEVLMRAHWLDCHQIQIEEIFLPMLVPDMCKEPGMPRMNLQGGGGTQADLPGPSGTQGVLPGPSVTPTVMPGTNPGPVSSKLPVSTAKEKKARGRERLRLEQEGKMGGKSLTKLSVTPTDSGTDTEPVAESTAADKVDAIDITAEALDLEIASLDEN